MTAANEKTEQVSNFPVKAGDVVLRDKPWIYSLFPENLPDYCYHCFKPLEQHREAHGKNPESKDVSGSGSGHGSTVSCSECGIPNYCSSKCQAEDKSCPFRHGDECKILQTLCAKGLQPGHDLMMVLKGMARLKVDKTGDFPAGSHLCRPPTDRTYNRLLPHTEKLLANDSRRKHIQELHQTLASILPQEDVPDFESVAQMHGKTTVNSFDIRDPYLRRLGEGLYLGASQFDHSCRRNTIFYFEGTSIVMKANTDIPAFTDVRVSYTEVFTASSLRLQNLQEWFYFRCGCHLCTNPQKGSGNQCTAHCASDTDQDAAKDHLADNKAAKGVTASSENYDWSCFNWHDNVGHRLLPIDFEQYVKIEQLTRTQPTSQVLEETERQCRNMVETAESSLQRKDFARSLLHATFAKVLLLSGPKKYAEAVQHLDLSLPALRRTVTERDPRLGLQLLIAALLHAEVGNFKEAQDRAREAADILSLVDGVERPLCQLAFHLQKLNSGPSSDAHLTDDLASGLQILIEVLCRSLFPVAHAGK